MPALILGKLSRAVVELRNAAYIQSNISNISNISKLYFIFSVFLVLFKKKKKIPKQKKTKPTAFCHCLMEAFFLISIARGEGES